MKTSLYLGSRSGVAIGIVLLVIAMLAVLGAIAANMSGSFVETSSDAVRLQQTKLILEQNKRLMALNTSLAVKQTTSGIISINDDTIPDSIVDGTLVDATGMTSLEKRNLLGLYFPMGAVDTAANKVDTGSSSTDGVECHIPPEGFKQDAWGNKICYIARFPNFDVSNDPDNATPLKDRVFYSPLKQALLAKLDGAATTSTALHYEHFDADQAVSYNDVSKDVAIAMISAGSDGVFNFDKDIFKTSERIAGQIKGSGSGDDIVATMTFGELARLSAITALEQSTALETQCLSDQVLAYQDGVWQCTTVGYGKQGIVCTADYSSSSGECKDIFEDTMLTYGFLHGDSTGEGDKPYYMSYHPKFEDLPIAVATGCNILKNPSGTSGSGNERYFWVDTSLLPGLILPYVENSSLRYSALEIQAEADLIPSKFTNTQKNDKNDPQYSNYWRAFHARVGEILKARLATESTATWQWVFYYSDKNFKRLGSTVSLGEKLEDYKCQGNDDTGPIKYGVMMEKRILN